MVLSIVAVVLVLVFWGDIKKMFSPANLMGSQTKPADGSSTPGENSVLGKPDKIELNKDRVLKSGVEGPEVKELQKRLNKAIAKYSLTLTPISEAGIFNIKTGAALGLAAGVDKTTLNEVDGQILANLAQAGGSFADVSAQADKEDFQGNRNLETVYTVD